MNPELIQSIEWDNPAVMTVLMVALALLPVALMSVTSFVKLSVVFGIIRNALGAGQVPSAAVSGLLAMVLTAQIMTPTATEIYDAIESELAKTQVHSPSVAGGEKVREKKVNTPPVKSSSIIQLFQLAEVAAQPVEKFLRQHSKPRERIFFAELAVKTAGKSTGDDPTAATTGITCSVEQGDNGQQEYCVPKGENFTTLVSAFVISELQAAFAIGFTVFLPFLVIDFVVANLLVGLGMMMVSPVAISLPFKLLLFVLCDGWFVLCRSLVLSY